MQYKVLHKNVCKLYAYARTRKCLVALAALACSVNPPSKARKRNSAPLGPASVMLSR